ncbi:imidazolonepropionase-like amidohydrolase [Microbacterium foliorum]|uniref:amidohydrolase family protein n=1 Tax=Microbacterium foliorum TaxID=104336 RepID=UPI00209DE98E|nr:amidohydrolase family protein [Microbacterium foliorum]MCP1427736.1 imidazolonepropionase-like amidohydrolase [Microbacterium foliorum]
MNAATFFDGEGWREGIVELIDGRMLLRDERPAPGAPRLDGVVIGGFTDHHVHLQLVDHTLLGSSTLGRVVDLGANPEAIAALAAARFVSVAGAPSLNERGIDDADARSLSERSETTRAPRVAIDFAGAFLTPVGGYPSDRDWAPAGSFREIADAETAHAAVTEMADAGASVIKVASNADAGPVFADDLFRAIVDAASGRGLPVVTHAQGSGEAQRVARLGATRQAHAPFTERLDDSEIAAQAASVAWISTLSIHDGDTLATAVDNVRRFHAAGGTVLYGTDMGNGPTPVGLNPAELDALRDAGIDGDDLLRSLAPQDPRDPASVLLHLADVTATPSSARPLTPADLKV